MSGFKPNIGGFGKSANAVGAAKVGMRPLAPLAMKAPDPLDGVNPEGNLEESTVEELGAIEKGFRERAAAEKERFLAATETSFYTCLVFDSGAQCDAFLKATGLDKGSSDLFVDGRVLAKMMGIELPPAIVDFKRDFKVDKKLAALAEPLKPKGGK